MDIVLCCISIVVHWIKVSIRLIYQIWGTWFEFGNTIVAFECQCSSIFYLILQLDSFSFHIKVPIDGSLFMTRSAGPFPAGVILHSFLGSAEMVPRLAKLGAYFSFSGHLMSLKSQKAKKVLKSVSLVFFSY